MDLNSFDEDDYDSSMYAHINENMLVEDLLSHNEKKTKKRQSYYWFLYE